MYHSLHPEIELFYFRNIRYIMHKAFNDNIRIDKNSIRTLIKGDINISKGFDDLTKEEIMTLNERLNEIVIGQEEAIEAVSRSIKTYYASNKNKGKPIGVLFFSGPTGVGKTHLAKCLAELCFGSEKCLIRFDMSEFSERHNAADLVGAPPGYIGYEKGSHFINKADEIKEGIILFDEFEKAHPDVLNVLLQVFDEGRLTDKRSGRVINFNNFIFIITSNIGQKESMNVNSPEEKRQIIFSCMKKTFAPELINRFDEIVYFLLLTKESCFKIAELELKKIISEKSIETGIEIIFDNQVVEFIVNKGFDPIFNARHLKRTIKKYFEEPFVDLLLEEKIKKGDKLRFVVFEDSNEIAFEKI